MRAGLSPAASLCMAALWASESNYVCVRYRAYRFDVILSVLPSRNPSLRQVQTGSLTNSHSPNDCPASHSLAGGGRQGGERESELDNLSAATSLRESFQPEMYPCVCMCVWSL